MNLKQYYFTENNCFKSGKQHTVKGILVHSTGANNPTLNRYVGPDDGLLGLNKYSNHWNTATPGGHEACVHAFIGKLADGSIATYQTLPWDIVGWHSGSGSLGYSRNANNNGYIGFEICEDDLTDVDYFNKVYIEAVELCVYLCKLYSLTEQNILCHSEGHKLGIASNHGDVMHWFPKFGKVMDTFRADVKEKLIIPTPAEPTTEIVIKDGDLVKITGSEYYGGKNIPDWVKNLNWYVHSINSDRAVIDKDENGKYAIMSPVNASDLAVVTATITEETYRIHTVVHGDTLWEIALKYLGDGSRYPEIVRLNDLKSNVIYSGQKLKIPK
ncbi:MAG: hypothetical protein A2Y17_11105 [Clostridiales bacterium GWF2_38_85]|nr:MAG: hypothetical protein A2Y17_11105 [Clostridiales bacterium GWF2_38_85]HBL84673.1 amidase [Clostridiales bacterium]